MREINSGNYQGLKKGISCLLFGSRIESPMRF